MAQWNRRAAATTERAKKILAELWEDRLSRAYALAALVAAWLAVTLTEPAFLASAAAALLGLRYRRGHRPSRAWTTTTGSSARASQERIRRRGAVWGDMRGVISLVRWLSARAAAVGLASSSLRKRFPPLAGLQKEPAARATHAMIETMPTGGAGC